MNDQTAMLTSMKTRTALATLALAALMLAGCGSTVESESAVEAEPVADSPVEEPTSTVAQWASLIAQQKASWEDWEQSWDESSCSGVTAGAEAGGMCRIQLLGATYQTQTTTIEYELAMSPGKKGFIAEEPPSEIATLFTATQEAAIAARDAGEDWDAADCSLTPASDCGALAVSFDRAIGELQSQFDAWSPYL